MRTSHAPLAWTPLPDSTVPARFRMDFFAPIQGSGAAPRGAAHLTWWLVEQVYAAGDADVDEVMTWADEHAGSDGTYALYSELLVERPGADLVLVELLAGQDPTPPHVPAPPAG